MSGSLAIVDWGIGGVGVLAELRRRIPSLPITYFSDAGYTPYGRLAKSELQQRLGAVSAYLAALGARGLVVACNAASTVLDSLELPSSLPTWGVIDSAVRVVPRSLTGALGVIGGGRTIRSGIYRRRLASPGRRVVQRIAQPLSAHVEAGTTGSEECARELDRILKPLRGAKGVLLACTHYPAIRELIRERLPGTELFDPAEALAKEVSRRWSYPDFPFSQRVLTTGDPSAMRRAAWLAWNVELGAIDVVRDLTAVGTA